MPRTAPPPSPHSVHHACMAGAFPDYSCTRRRVLSAGEYSKPLLSAPRPVPEIRYRSHISPSAPPIPRPPGAARGLPCNAPTLSDPAAAQSACCESPTWLCAQLVTISTSPSLPRHPCRASARLNHLYTHLRSPMAVLYHYALRTRRFPVHSHVLLLCSWLRFLSFSSPPSHRQLMLCTSEHVYKAPLVRSISPRIQQ